MSQILHDLNFTQHKLIGGDENALHDHQRRKHLPHCTARVVEGAEGRVDPGGDYSRDLDSRVVKRTRHKQAKGAPQ